jgi:hypothetical protein
MGIGFSKVPQMFVHVQRCKVMDLDVRITHLLLRGCATATLLCLSEVGVGLGWRLRRSRGHGWAGLVCNLEVLAFPWKLEEEDGTRDS